MDVLRQILLILHFVGIAALLGGVLTQVGGVKTGNVRITPAITYGALTMLVTGLALYETVKDGLHDDISTAKIATKLGIVVVILLIAWGNREKERIDSRLYAAVGLLTIANISIAVMWN